MILKENQRAELKTFIERNYNRNYILLNDVFFNYFFKKRNNAKGYNFRVLNAGGRLTGMSGEIPNNFNFFGKTIKGCSLINLMIDKNVRGYGLGPRLLLESVKDYDLLYTCSYSDDMKPVFRKWKWAKMPNLRRFVKILSFQKANELALWKLKKTDETAEYIDSADEEFSFEKIKSFDSSFFEFWKKIKDKYPITIERNDDYLNWRYSDHPLFKYETFAVRKDNEIKSFIVFRIEESGGYKISRIVDFISTDDAERFTLHKAIKYYMENNVELIDFFFTGNFHIDSLLALGFKDTEEEQYSSIPWLFNPIDRKRKYINFAYKIVNPDFEDDRAKSFNNWYITKADGDSDRPN